MLIIQTMIKNLDFKGNFDSGLYAYFWNKSL